MRTKQRRPAEFSAGRLFVDFALFFLMLQQPAEKIFVFLFTCGYR